MISCFCVDSDICNPGPGQVCTWKKKKEKLTKSISVKVHKQLIELLRHFSTEMRTDTARYSPSETGVYKETKTETIFFRVWLKNSRNSHLLAPFMPRFEAGNVLWTTTFQTQSCAQWEGCEVKRTSACWCPENNLRLVVTVVWFVPFVDTVNSSSLASLTPV